MRKAFVLVISILCFAVIESTAQGRYNGYVITNEDDTITGIIEVGNPALQAVRVIFTDYEVHTPVQLEPFQIKRYYANNQLFQSKIYDVDEGLDYGYAVFMEVVEDGHVTFYKYWNNDKRRFELLLEDANKSMILVNKSKFSKQMSEYFKDYAVLKAKILRGVYKKRDLDKIVSEYNSWKYELSITN
jgi:hypothetical protein